MKKTLVVVLASVLSLLFVACSKTNPVPQNVKFMNESELKATFNDKTITGLTSGSNVPYELKFNSNGNYSGSINSNQVSGKWFIKGNDKCIKLNNKTYCSKHYKLDGKYYTYNEQKNTVVPFTVK